MASFASAGASPSAGTAARRFVGVALLLAVFLVALWAFVTYTSSGQRLAASLFPGLVGTAPPGSAAGTILDPTTGQAAEEVWYDWAYLDASRCYIDLDGATAERERADEGAVEVNCRPDLPSRIPFTMFTLQTQASSRGNNRLRRVPCPDQASLPPCCLPDRAGLQANPEVTTASGEPDARPAMGLLCTARYGCETDPVYARELIPWLPSQPMNCFSEANTNTCVQLLLDRAEPGTLSSNPAVAAPEDSRETLRFICDNDTRAGPSRVVPGPQVPRMTPAELRLECRAAGFEPRQDPAQGCA
jgi:hypothetical protein